MVKNLPAVQETWAPSLGQEDPLEKEMATLSSLLAWEIPWTEEPGGLQSMELQRVRCDLATKQQHVLFYMWKNSSCPPDLSKTLYERVNSRHMWGQLLMQEETYTTSSSLRSWVPRSSFPALSSLSRLAPSHFASFTFFFILFYNFTILYWFCHISKCIHASFTF